MQKAKNFLSFVCSGSYLKRSAVAGFAFILAITSILCANELDLRSHAPDVASFSGSQRMILKLSENYLSPHEDNNISVIKLNNAFTETESESLSIIEETSTGADTEKSTEEQTVKAESTTEAAPAPKAAATEKQTEAPTQPQTQAYVQSEIQVDPSVDASAQGGYTFEQLGLSQMSDIPVPDDILFDENGVPLNYSFKLTGKGTAYNMGTTTATGTSVHPGVVAVNPNIIPYGSKMYIVSADGSVVYGYSSAEDTGGFIYWNNAPIVDMYVNSYSDACIWGARQVTVYVF